MDCLCHHWKSCIVFRLEEGSLLSVKFSEVFHGSTDLYGLLVAVWSQS